MYRFSSCCGCGSLKTGTLVIGWLFLIGTVLNTLSVIRKLFQHWQLATIIPGMYEDMNYNLGIGLGSTALIFNVIALVVSSLLIYGVNKNRPSFITPFIVYTIGSAVVLSGCAVVSAVILADMPVAAVICVFVILCLVALYVYFALIAKSYQAELLESATSNHICLNEDPHKLPTSADQQAVPYTDQIAGYGGQPAAHTTPSYGDNPPAYGANPPAYGFKS